MSGDIVKGLFENMDDDTKRRFEEHVAAQVEQNLREQGELPSPNTPGAMNFTPDDQAAPFRHVSKPDQDGYMDYLPPDPAFVDEPVTTVDWPKLEALFVKGRHVEPSDVDWEELGVNHPESGMPLLNCKRCLSIWNTPTQHWCNPIRETESNGE